MMKTVRIAGIPLEPLSPRSESIEDWVISSESYLNSLITKTAYSIGAILGDGYMTLFPQCCTELAGMDVEVLDRFIHEIGEAFGEICSVHTKKLPSGVRFHAARTSSRLVHNFFWSLTSGKTEIPMEVIRGGSGMKCNLLAGLFDTDGTVKLTETWNGSRTKKNPRWQLGFSNTKRPLIESVAAILHSLNVKVGKIHTYHRNSYRTIYAIHPNTRSFIDAGCYFHADRKQKRLSDYLSRVVGSETMHTAPVTSGEDIVHGVAKTTL